MSKKDRRKARERIARRLEKGKKINNYQNIKLGDLAFFEKKVPSTATKFGLYFLT